MTITSSSSLAVAVIDGEALIRARRHGARRFEKLVEFYRAGGATDAMLARAMADARGMISPLRLRGGQ